MLIKPKLMLIEECVYRRMEHYHFSDDYYYSAYGYQGEKLFNDTFPLNDNYIQRFNLTMQHYYHHFEVDRLIITGETIYALDVKGHHRTYKNEREVWRKDGKTIKSPISQYKQMKEGMESLKQMLGLPHQVVCKMVFIQPGFDIDVKEEGVLLFKDIKYLMKHLHSEHPVGKIELDVLNYFETIQKPISLYERRPEFDMNNIQSGILCEVCGMSITLGDNKDKNVSCIICNQVKTKEEWVYTALMELELLLNRGITITEANKWIGRRHRNIVRRVLNKHFVSNNEYYKSAKKA